MKNRLFATYLLTMFLSLVTAASHAQESRPLTAEQIKHLTLASVKTEVVGTEQSAHLLSDLKMDSARAKLKVETFSLSSDDELILDSIINMGKKLWQLVDAGRPVVSIDLQTATAMPEGIKSWQELENWQTPVSRVYRVSAKNLYGMNVLDFTYRLLYVYGGSYKGAGKYLARVAVQPVNVDVAWGYTFGATAGVPSVTNAGTKVSPVAGAEISVNWQINTPLKHNQGSGAYYVRGDGVFKDLSGTTAGTARR